MKPEVSCSIINSGCPIAWPTGFQIFQTHHHPPKPVENLKPGRSVKQRKPPNADVSITNWDEGGKAFAEAFKATNGGQDQTAPSPPADTDETDDEQQTPALTKPERLTLCTLAGFDAAILVSAVMLADAMSAAERLSERTIRDALKKLIVMYLAERPEGKNKGVRLTMKGRRLAAKIAD